MLIFDQADAESTPKKLISVNTSVPVYGSYQNFYFVKIDGLTGWIKR